MMGDSDTQASFSLSVRIRLRQQYSDRCAICLLVIPDGGSLACTQCVHLLDANQVTTAQSFGNVANDFQANSVGNGLLLCPLCRVAFFAPNHVALSPPMPVLRYIHKYLKNTPVADQLPLHEVFQLLRDAATGVQVDLPDPTPVLPYFDLFSLVVMNPAEVAGLRIPTLHYPPVSSIQNGSFRLMSTRSTRSTITARIFDVVGAGDDIPDSLGVIPLSPEHPEFNTQRYWRLPINTEVILSILINRVLFLPPSPGHGPEIELTRSIHAQQIINLYGGIGSGNIRKTAAGPFKTRERGEPTRKKRRTKMDPGLGIVKRARGQSPVSSCERPLFGVDPKEWIVTTTPFSTLADGEPQPTTGAYSEYSPPSNRESECGEDNPKRWSFGPSFTTDRIIAEARQTMKL